MKEIGYKTVVGQAAAEFDTSTRTKALTEAVVRRVTKESDGKFFQTVPKEYKGFIVGMAVNNMDVANKENVQELLASEELTELKEDISRSWLIRRDIVPHIMRGEGFEDIRDLRYEPNQGDFNRSTIAVLSGKGTIMMVGRGGLIPEGSSIVWEPLPERRQERKHVPNLDNGARVVGKPELGRPWGIQYRTFEDFGSKLVRKEEAASLVAVFKGSADADLKGVEEQILISTTETQRLLQKKR